MEYLLPAEYAEYGLSTETTDDWITMASALMEAHCRRPSLMVTEYVERMRLTTGSQEVRLSYRPLASADGVSAPVSQVRVRYGRPRRGELADTFREQVLWAFSVPGTWTTLDVTTVDVDLTSGEMTLPGNFLGLSYNEVEVTYSAGVAEVAPALKVACAQIVRNAQATPALNVRSSKLDTMQVQYFSGVLIDAHVQALLRPYVAERLG